MNLKTIRLALIPAFLLFLSSCEESGKVDESITQTEVSEEDLGPASNENVSKVQDIFHSVPSPMEMAGILKKAGAQYDAKLLNDVKNVNDYSTAQSQALNLGIFGADLSYASVFNMNQESILYLSCTKKLADKLGMSKAFNDDVIERMEMNIDNRDSLLNIISETYYLIDAYLKENNRDHISAMVIAAGWIEGLYLGTSVATASDNPEQALLDRIAEQKLSLDDLIELVDSYNKEGKLDFVLEDLRQIDAAYADVTVSSTAGGTTKSSDGVTTLGGKTSNTMSTETLKSIANIVKEIRSQYVAA
jgi:uncharacterized protein YjgD (DUF1641 family)